MPDDTLTSRRADPLVDRYVTTDLPLLQILHRAPNPDNPIVKALTMLRECLEGQRLAKDAIEAAQSVPLADTDPEMRILMLSNWAELACRIRRPSEAEALLHQVKSLVTAKTHPEMLAAAKLAESALADTRGNKTRREEIMREVLELVPSQSPRRKFYIWEMALFLAQQGRAAEVRPELKELTWQCNEGFPLSRVQMVQFINAVETGRIQEASQLLPEISGSTDAARRVSRVRCHGYQVLLGLMHAATSDSLTQREKPLRLPRRPVWTQVIYYLLTQDTVQALKLARLEARRHLGSLLDTGFGSLNLVRAELAAGNHEAARRLISMRRTRGNGHYLDDLFLARSEFLAGNKGRAGAAFTTALHAAEGYDARPRVDFELRLAVELSQGDIVELTRVGSKRKKHHASDAPAKRRPPKDASPRKNSISEPPDDSALSLRSGAGRIMGRSPATRAVREEVMRFADLDTPVLITGETGTGKELVARALHHESKRRDAPFTAVNCGAIAETLLESELFGHEKGAFTGAERANKGLFEETAKGTILLDEIGQVSPRLQMALLRVLETGEIRAIGSAKTRNIACRVVAATNIDLSLAAQRGEFRKDLMFRLQRLGIEVPPLRDRKEDIMLLVRHFLDAGRPVGTHCNLTREFVEAVREYDWPGNIRELRNVIERMRLMHSDKLSYTLADLDIKFQSVPELVRKPLGNQIPPARVVPSDADSPSHGATARQSYLDDAAPPHPTHEMNDTDIERLLRGGQSPLRRVDRLRKLFGQHRKLTRSEIVRILGVSPNTATKYLKELCGERFIRRVEPSASTRSHYFMLVEAEKKRPVLRARR